MVIHGPFGSGKTILGLEVARIIASRRKDENLEKNVKILFTAHEASAAQMLKYLKEKYYNIYADFEKQNSFVPRDFYNISGVSISQGSLSRFSKWFLFVQQDPLRCPKYMKIPKVIKTIKLLYTVARIQVTVTSLYFITFR